MDNYQKYFSKNFYKINAKIQDIKMLKTIPLLLENAVPYYQTLKQMPWPLRLEKLKKW